MNVKGTAFITRKNQIINSFGKEKWEIFFNHLKEKDNYFITEPAPVSLIPIQSFLLLNEEMINAFYENNQKMYWVFGEHSAAWALTEGPYKVFMTSKNLSSFIEQTMPLVWSTYYTEGKMVGVIDQKSITVKIKGITMPHIYFEYTTMSFVKKALELFGLKNIRHECVNGFDSGHEEIHYVFYFD
jgi:hypothetical protein